NGNRHRARRDDTSQAGSRVGRGPLPDGRSRRRSVPGEGDEGRMRTHGAPMLIERATPPVRQALIGFRGMAMRGELEKVDSALREELSRRAGSGNDLDVIVLAMLRAEILYLDGQDALALEQFELLIRPRIDRLDLSTRLTVEQNHIEIRTHRL